MQSTQNLGGKKKNNNKKTTPSEEQSIKKPNLKQKAIAPTYDGKDKPTTFPCKLCAEDHMTWHCPRLQECTKYITRKDTSETTAILKNPFLT